MAFALDVEEGPMAFSFHVLEMASQGPWRLVFFFQIIFVSQHLTGFSLDGHERCITRTWKSQ